MREIKFRAWFGKPHYREPHMAYLDINDDFGGNSATWQLRKLQHPEEDGPVYMQFTGLTDKNDVEIYEGDIVKSPSYLKKYQISNVFFENGSFAIYLDGTELSGSKDKKGRGWIELSQYSFTDELEVIGNQYENPELLEGSE